ncbi:MAG: hypothetical protein FJY20_07220 [Bacteroidetes bacterium]|nr:hypothetical protein [Bacteroidota bacterium]
MKIFLLKLLLFSVAAITSCRQKEKETKNDFISVVSLIRADVAHVDTSLYSILKMVTYDSLRTDTQYIPREKFKDEAKDFLDIPDLGDKKVARKYKNDPPRYDELLGRVIFKYTPIHPEKEEVKSQELLATPVPGADARINNVIIIREISNRDSFLQKKMLWQMNRSFQIITTAQKPGKPEITTITRVTWNEQPDQ